jgi:AcrR family transcriptional regulator
VTEKARATGRPREAILSRNLIRDQALAIIDEEGLASLTMRRLAARLGVQAASLYAHFPNKEAVLDAIADDRQRRPRAL